MKVKVKTSGTRILLSLLLRSPLYTPTFLSLSASAAHLLPPLTGWQRRRQPADH